MIKTRLYKKEKLCSAVAIEQLFSRDSHTDGALAYPLRAVWRLNPRRSSDAPLCFLVSVPKKRLRHAVDRVAMRRRVREAYRLNRHDIALPEGVRIDIAFIYVASGLKPYQSVESAVCRLLDAVAASMKTVDKTGGAATVSPSPSPDNEKRPD
ncbi:MAG: ribonuclease P protein component [Muribaculaceae bacterium]